MLSYIQITKKDLKKILRTAYKDCPENKTVATLFTKEDGKGKHEIMLFDICVKDALFDYKS